MRHDPNDAADAGPRGWVAVTLSLLCTGLGQMHCGRMRRGLGFFLPSLLFAPMLLLAAGAVPSRNALVAAAATVLGVVVLYVVAAVDAGLLASRVRRTGKRERPPGLVLSTLFVLVGVLHPLAAALHLRATAWEAFEVSADSMAPSLLTGDRVLVEKLPAGRRPQRGEVVVFRDPDRPSAFLIKRVVGVDGDRVELSRDEVRVNGSPLPRSPDPGEKGAWWETNGDARYRIRVEEAAPSADSVRREVPPGHVYVLGDRRSHSKDSRRLGPIPLSEVVGRAVFLYWPWERLGAVE